MTNRHGLDKFDICPDTSTEDTIDRVRKIDPVAPKNVTEVGGAAKVTAVKNVVGIHLCKKTDKSIDVVKGTGVKGSVHACRVDEALNRLPGKPSVVG